MSIIQTRMLKLLTSEKQQFYKFLLNTDTLEFKLQEAESEIYKFDMEY